ncbi:hypothetical protein FKW77_000470 [Venturia effusa]|uniref:Amine oxidase n=1 Tax=Venturia effusa TaxID=50376 RepID=A0A517KVN4_9PEZI|nr:hypothetical protein FKW77_000470 [Venturia effusa]
MALSAAPIDVIVVGAGLTGLQAAVSLHNAGLRVLVLEGRDRVGGKTLSRGLEGAISDMGAAWINSTNQSKMFRLTQDFDLEAIEQNTHGNIVMHDLDGSVHMFPYGKTPKQEVEIGGVKDMIRMRDLFETLCQKIDIYDPNHLSSLEALGGVDYDQMSMKGFVEFHKGGETAMCTVTIWTRAMLGVEPGEISALWFLRYCKAGGGLMQMRSDRKDGGQFLRIAEGTQSFSKGLASSLLADSISLNSPVTDINDIGTSVVVSTKNKTYRAKHVVLSLPTTLYNTIQFSPPLPDNKSKLATRTIHGNTSKVFLSYATPWWRDLGSCGLTQSLKGLVAVTRDTSNDTKGHFSLLCFLVGDPGRRWSLLSPPERRAAVETHIKALYQPIFAKKGKGQKVPALKGYTEQIWSNEVFSGGCPCPAFPPGLMSEVGGEIGNSVGNLFFVGTETASKWRGYMEGAVRSGERGAEEVIKSLRNEPARL